MFANSNGILIVIGKSAAPSDLVVANKIQAYLAESLPFIRVSIELDSAIRDTDLATNDLIIVGGPVVNAVTRSVHMNLPLRFQEASHFEKSTYYILNSRTNTTYGLDSDNHGNLGLASLIRSPWDQSKYVLVAAAIEANGTRAAGEALLGNYKVAQGSTDEFFGDAVIVNRLEPASGSVLNPVGYGDFPSSYSLMHTLAPR
jgi:hypothetical protein